MDHVHRMDLTHEFFFVFSRFEHALLTTNYLTEGKSGVSGGDWNKFARDMNDSISGSSFRRSKKGYSVLSFGLLNCDMC